MTYKRSSVIRDFSAFVSRYKTRFYKRMGVDIVMGKREGIYFFDKNGKEFINCHCNGGVFNLGHRNPRVIASTKGASDHFDIGNHHFISEARAQLAKRLSASLAMPGSNLLRSNPLKKVVFAVSGGEAVDLALKVSRGFTKKQKIVSLVGGYHGHTGLAMATGDAKYRDPFAISLPDFEQIEINNEVALEAALDSNTAALILETVPATLGMQILSPGFIKKARSLCDERKVVLIFDEIQTGLGRTGKRWGFHHYGVYPDMVVTGKGLSGGIYPMAATCFAKKFESIFKKDPFIHISTFGGAELGCQAALEVLDISFEESFLANVNKQAEYFRREFTELLASEEVLMEFRQLGMFMAFTLVDRNTALTMLKALFSRGIFAVYANNDKKTIQFLPPLIINDDQALLIMGRLKQAFADLNSLRYKLIKKAISILL